MATIRRDLEFLYEIGTLAKMPRGWRQHLGMDCASVLEHTVRVIFLALLIARREGFSDEEKIITMALVHDLAETRTSDLSYVQKVYVQTDESRATNDLFAGTSLEDLNSQLLTEFERRETPAAKIVKDADNLDIDLELRELDERGSKLPEKWQEFRQMVRDDKLYTQAAKDLWDQLQTVDVSSWHLTANKWLKMPNAGR